MTNIKPVIKWSGSKRSQANIITKLMPPYRRYYEPFVGGASILYASNPSDAVAGDICVPLVELWQKIKMEPKTIIKSYERDWNRLQDEGYQVYYEIRDRFNKTQNPNDLMFLSRTCVNGLIRFNKKGEFNNSLHHTRKGINPKSIKKIIKDWSYKISNFDFRAGDYRETTFDIQKNDFIYLDPPYFNTKGRYFGTIDYNEFITYLYKLNSLGVKFALSFDGKRGVQDYTIDIPKDIYKEHIFIESGNSSFKKVMDKSCENVMESLYMNY